MYNMFFSDTTESTDSLNFSAYENMRERNSIGPSVQRDSRDRAHYMRSEYIHTNNDSDDVNCYTGDSDVTVGTSDVDKEESDAESGVYYNVSGMKLAYWIQLQHSMTFDLHVGLLIWN